MCDTEPMDNSGLKLIEKVGVSMYRTLDWAAPLARFLGVETRTMQRIGEAARVGRSYRVQRIWLTTLRDNLRAQARDYAAMADELEAAIARTDSEAP